MCSCVFRVWLVPLLLAFVLDQPLSAADLQADVVVSSVGRKLSASLKVL